MKLSDIIYNDIGVFLVEAFSQSETSWDSYKKLKELKKYGFDANKNLWDNEATVAEKYRRKVEDLVKKHTQNLNREIYQYISQNYKNIRKIYWKSSMSTVSQYTYFILNNGKHLGIKVSDHTTSRPDFAKVVLLNVYFNTPFTDNLKRKIDNFINYYDFSQKMQKSA